MPFRNPIVAGLNLIREAIRSFNYVTGVSGWSIERDGSAEFQDLVARGNLRVNQLIAGTLGGARVEITPTNLIEIYDSSNVLVAQLTATSLKAVGDNGSYAALNPDLGTLAALILNPNDPSTGHATSTPALLYAETNLDVPRLFMQSPQIDGQASAQVNLFGAAPGGSPGTLINLVAVSTQVQDGLNVQGASEFVGDATFDGRVNLSTRHTNTVTQVDGNNDTTFRNITGLSAPVVANQRYDFQFLIKYSATAVANFKIQATGPALADVSLWWFQGLNTAGAASTGPSAAGVVAGLDGQGTGTPLIVMGRGLIAVGANAGTVNLQFGKNTAEASNVSIFTGSYMDLIPLLP